MRATFITRRTRGTRAKRGNAGQAVTETLLLTWLIIVFIAAALQIFIMNESMTRTVTAAHADIFKNAFKHNGWHYTGPNSDLCVTPEDVYDYNYNVDDHAKAILSYQNYPEIRVPMLGMFRGYGAPGVMDIHSNYPGRPLEPSKGCVDYPCKKLRTGAGAAGPSTDDSGREYWLRPVDVPAHIRLYCKAGHVFVDSISDGYNQLMECANSDSFFGCLF
jgi:hypothetical protein